MRKSIIGTVLCVTLVMGTPSLTLAEHAFDEGIDYGPKSGCTLGYWKNHYESWAALDPHQTLGSLFTVVPGYEGLADYTLAQALSFRGGPGLEDAARLLYRQAVAGLLNAAHPQIRYSLGFDGVRGMTRRALASHDRDTIIGRAAILDELNNRRECVL